MELNLKIIIGSTRPGRVGPKVAQWVKEASDEFGKFNVELVDLEDFDLPVFDEPKHPAMRDYQHAHTKKWSAAVGPGDAFVFVTPEYDFFPPAGLINAIQFLLKEWAYKPAAIVSYGGVSGGLRSSQELRLLLANVGMMPIPQTVPVPFVSKHIGEDGVLTTNDPMRDGINGMLGELHKWATALKPMREAV